MEKLRIDLPIIVEGKYDKNTIKQIFDATVISTDGFGIFNATEKQALLRRLSDRGIILLVDPDGGGVQIRSFLNRIIPKDKIYNAYVPRIAGKERRKTAPSREGVLGVEGMTRDVLTRALSPFIIHGERAELTNGDSARMITKVDFFADGLSGGENSASRRAMLAEHFDLPRGMSANALLEALNLLVGFDGYKAALRELFVK